MTEGMNEPLSDHHRGDRLGLLGLIAPRVRMGISLTLMTGSPSAKASSGRTHAWWLSIPSLVSLAILCLSTVLPHDALRLGDSGFNVFNVWIILAGPVAGLAFLELCRASLTPLPRAFLGISNAAAVLLSVGTLLAAAGV